MIIELLVFSLISAFGFNVVSNYFKLKPKEPVRPEAEIKKAMQDIGALIWESCAVFIYISIMILIFNISFDISIWYYILLMLIFDNLLKKYAQKQIDKATMFLIIYRVHERVMSELKEIVKRHKKGDKYFYR